MDREAWRAEIHGVAKSRTRLSDSTELNWTQNIILTKMEKNWYKTVQILKVSTTQKTLLSPSCSFKWELWLFPFNFRQTIYWYTHISIVWANFLHSKVFKQTRYSQKRKFAPMIPVFVSADQGGFWLWDVQIICSLSLTSPRGRNNREMDQKLGVKKEEFWNNFAVT